MANPTTVFKNGTNSPGSSAPFQPGDNNRIRQGGAMGEYSDSPLIRSKRVITGESPKMDTGGRFAREIEDRQIGGTERKTGGREGWDDIRPNSDAGDPSPLKAMFRRVADRVLGAGKTILATVTKPEVHRIRVNAPQFAMGGGSN